MAELSATNFAHKLERVHWSTAAYAAAVAAAAFIVLQMLIAVAVQGESAWQPVRMIAAIVMGPGVLAETGPAVWFVLVAFFVHLWLSILTAWILAPVVEGMALGKAVAFGAAGGLVIYLVNFYLLTAAVPWFTEMRGLATLLNHLLFGALLVWTYKHRRALQDRGRI